MHAQIHDVETACVVAIASGDRLLFLRRSSLDYNNLSMTVSPFLNLDGVTPVISVLRGSCTFMRDPLVSGEGRQRMKNGPVDVLTACARSMNDSTATQDETHGRIGRSEERSKMSDATSF